MSKMTYSEQLRHPLWQRRRLSILEKANWSCQGCGAVDQTLHVHHKRYVKGRLAWQYEDAELAALCETCHQGIHHAQDVFSGVLAFAPIVGPFSVKEAMALVAGFVGVHDETPTEFIDPFPECVLEFNIGYAARSMSAYLGAGDIADLGSALSDHQFSADLLSALQAYRKRLEDSISFDAKVRP